MRMQAVVNVVWRVIAGTALVAVCSIFTGEGKDILGLMYDKGYVVSQDYREAAKWYSRAAEQGNTRAQLDLALRYALGQGVPVNYVKACMWVTIASKQNEKRGDEAKAAIESHMTREDTAIGQYMAYLWMQQHSKSAFYPVFRDTDKRDYKEEPLLTVKLSERVAPPARLQNRACECSPHTAPQ